MASNREIRKFTFQALFQLDAHHGSQPEIVSQWLKTCDDLSEDARAKVYRLALEAFSNRKLADDEFTKLAPTWPAYRQPAVDRALLRLAHYELTKGEHKDQPRLVMNDIIELCKQFSTDKSPGFVNGLLDKVYKRLHPQAASVVELAAVEPAAVEPAAMEHAAVEPAAVVAATDEPAAVTSVSNGAVTADDAGAEPAKE